MSNLLIRSSALVLYGASFFTLCLIWLPVTFTVWSETLPLTFSLLESLRGERKNREGMLAQTTSTCRLSENWESLIIKLQNHDTILRKPRLSKNNKRNEKCQKGRIMFSPLILVHIHNNSQDVEDQHHSTYNVRNHRNNPPAAWKTGKHTTGYQVRKLKEKKSAETTSNTYLLFFFPTSGCQISSICDVFVCIKAALLSSPPLHFTPRHFPLQLCLISTHLPLFCSFTSPHHTLLCFLTSLPFPSLHFSSLHFTS